MSSSVWSKIKRDAKKKAEYRGTDYFLIRHEGKDVWVSRDRAGSGHAGSAFKVWADKGSTINFIASYDENFKKMSKHESNAGNTIQKSKMNMK